MNSIIFIMLSKLPDIPTRVWKHINLITTY